MTAENNTYETTQTQQGWITVDQDRVNVGIPASETKEEALKLAVDMFGDQVKR